MAQTYTPAHRRVEEPPENAFEPAGARRPCGNHPKVDFVQSTPRISTKVMGLFVLTVAVQSDHGFSRQREVSPAPGREARSGHQVSASPTGLFNNC